MKAGKRKEALLAGERHYFTGKPCKYGHIDKRLTVNGNCFECTRIKNAEIYETYLKPYVKKNKEKIKQIASRWQKNNKGKVNARTAERHSAKMKRTPKWLDQDDKWIIQEIYELASLRTKLTGVAWNVDHVIPMQGDIVSGLHCPDNLRVVVASENFSKNNKWNWENQSWN